MVTKEEALEAVRAYFASDGTITKEATLAIVQEYQADRISGVSISKKFYPVGAQEWVTVTATFADGTTSEYQAEMEYINRIGGLDAWVIECVEGDPKFAKNQGTPATTPKTNAATTLKASIPTTVLLPIVAIILIIIFLIRSVRK